MLTNSLGKTLQQLLIHTFRLPMDLCTSVVEESHNSRRVLSLNEITDDFVVEVVDLGPLDPLLYVLFLFSLQRQLDKNLLELFVHKVDTGVRIALVEKFTDQNCSNPLLSKISNP